MKCIDVVYITSVAYSGSTILGFIIGSSPKIFNAGEIHYFNFLQKNDQLCSCGTFSRKCPFWSNIYNYNYILNNNSLLNKIKMLSFILFNKKIKQNVLFNSVEYDLLCTLYKEAKKIKPETKYIIDNSKSLWRLIHLMKCAEINLKIIFLKRDISGNVASFVKYNKGFWKGLVRIIITNLFIKKLLLVNNLDHITVSYNNLCNNCVKEIDKIEFFLNINIKEYFNKLDLKNTHVPSGNIGTRKSLENFNGLHLDISWKDKLSKFQKVILKIVK